MIKQSFAFACRILTTRCMIFCLLLTTVSIVCAERQPTRSRILLDGIWESAPGNIDDGDDIPQKNWKPQRVPHWDRRYVIGGKDCPVKWYRRTVDVPAEWRGKQLILRFGAVHYRATVFVNGKKIGEQVGSFLPMEFNITNAVQFGQSNQIVVRVEGITAIRSKKGNRYIYSEPIAAGYGSEKGPLLQGIWQSVYLIARPRLHLSGIRVTPSVRHHRLAVEAEVVNDSTQDGEFTVETDVLDNEGRSVISLDSKSLRVRARHSRSIKLTRSWNNPRLWWPYDPVLYRLEMRLLNRDGETIDRTLTRFGFREVWVEDGHRILNGARISFLRRWHDCTYWTLTAPSIESEKLYTVDNILKTLRKGHRKAKKQFGIQIYRMHYWPPPVEWVHIADEEGMPLIIEGPFMGPSGSAHPVEDDALWSHLTDFWIRLAKHYYNSPSVWGYSLENEVFHNTWPREKALERWQRIRDAVRSVDPMRWLWQESGNDVRVTLEDEGLHDITVAHGGLGDDGVGVPDNPIAVLKKHQRGFYNVYGTAIKWPRSKPLIFGEWYVNFFGPQLNGERMWDRRYTFENAFWQSRMWAVHAYMVVMKLNGLNGANPWRLDINTVGPEGAFLWPMVDVIPEKWITHAYASDIFAFHATLTYDRLREQKLQIEWSLQRTTQSHAALLSPTPLCSKDDPGGVVVTSGQIALRVEAGGRYSVDIDVPLPDAPEKTDLMLVILIKEPLLKTQWIHQWPIRVYPRRKIDADNLRIGCIGASAVEALKRLGVSAKRVEGELPGDYDLVVVSADEMTAIGDTMLHSLLDFVSGGGVVLVLEQSRWRDGLVPVQLTLHPTRSTSLAYVRAHRSQWLSGMDNFDFYFWRPRGAFVSRPFRKPAGGNVINLVDSGGPVSLDTSFMLEVAAGRGRFLLCQLPVGRLAGVEPAADMLWRNILQHIERGSKKMETLGVFAGRPELNSALKQLGVDAMTIDANKITTRANNLPGVIIVPGDVELSTDTMRRLSEWVRKGRTLILHRLSPALCPRWRDALGLDIRVMEIEQSALAADTEPKDSPAYLPGHSWRYKQLLLHQQQVTFVRRESLLDGVSLEDLTWDNRMGSMADYVLTGSAGSSSPLRPAVLVIASCGKGRMVIDQLRWDSAIMNAERQSLRGLTPLPPVRYISALLTNLGVFIPGSRRASRVVATYVSPFRIYTPQQARRLNSYDTPYEGGKPLTHYDRVMADTTNRGPIAWRLEDIPAGRYRLRLHCRIYNSDDPVQSWEMRVQGVKSLRLEFVDSLPLIFENTTTRGSTQIKADPPNVYYGYLQTVEPVLLKPGQVIVVGSNRWLSYVKELELYALGDAGE